jgi:hypothetical protein
VTNDAPITVEGVIEQLSARRVDAVATLEMLQAHRDKVDAEAAQLENPQAVREYVEYFQRVVAQAVATLQRIAADLTVLGALQSHVSELRQLASNASAEQRRCLQFRDKVINKPLPHERLRPFLNDISVTTRDQLTAFRDLNAAADRLQTLLPPPVAPKEPERRYDRRALFTRIFKLPEK